MKVRKLVCLIILSLLIITYIPINANAFDYKDYNENVNVDELLDSLPENAKKYIPQEFFSANDITEISSQIDGDTLRDYTVGLLKTISQNTMKMLPSLLAIIILISLINTAKNSIASESFQRGIEYITTLALSIYTYEIITNATKYLSEFMNGLDILINALIPIMATLYSMGGNVSAAVVGTAGMSMTITATNYAIQHIFLPFLKVCFGLLLAGRISGIKGINQVEKTLRNILTTSLIGTTTIFSVFLVFKTNISVASDGLTARTIKFAGSFIPVVGSSLGESVRTVMTGISLIKNSVGFVGIFILLAITLPSILQVIVTKFTIDISSNISYILGNEKEGEFLKNMSSIFNFLIAVTVTVSILFMFELTVFIFVSPSLSS